MLEGRDKTEVIVRSDCFSKQKPKPKICARLRGEMVDETLMDAPAQVVLRNKLGW
jgi:hypothetical protein